MDLILEELASSLPDAREAARVVIRLLAALGVTIGLGQLGTAAVGVLFAWIVLAVLIRLERSIDNSSNRA